MGYHHWGLLMVCDNTLTDLRSFTEKHMSSFLAYPCSIGRSKVAEDLEFLLLNFQCHCLIHSLLNLIFFHVSEMSTRFPSFCSDSNFWRISLAGFHACSELSPWYGQVEKGKWLMKELEVHVRQIDDNIFICILYIYIYYLYIHKNSQSLIGCWAWWFFWHICKSGSLWNPGFPTIDC